MLILDTHIRFLINFLYFRQYTFILFGFTNIFRFVSLVLMSLFIKFKQFVFFW